MNFTHRPVRAIVNNYMSENNTALAACKQLQMKNYAKHLSAEYSKKSSDLQGGPPGGGYGCG